MFFFFLKKAFSFTTRPCQPANKVGWNVVHVTQLRVHVLHQGIPLRQRKVSELQFHYTKSLTVGMIFTLACFWII